MNLNGSASRFVVGIFKIHFPAFIVITLMMCSNVYAQQTITWGVFHRPPSIDITDINHPSGYSGESLQILQKNMPDYKFS